MDRVCSEWPCDLADLSFGGVCLAGTRIDGRIAPRSGLASKNFIDTGAGVIDADYRGHVRVLLFNHSEVDFQGLFYLGFFFGLKKQGNRRADDGATYSQGRG